MFKNYLKTALRQVKKNPVYSLINILGLAIGVTCCILISTYVLHETSYDTFHQNGDRIFRSTCFIELNDILYEEASVPFPAAAAFKNNFPEVEATVRLYQDNQFPLIQVGQRKFTEESFFFADENFFTFFDFPLLKGDPLTVLQQPGNIVLTHSAAQKYFGDSDPVGKTIKYQNETSFLVTGVVEDVPQNSHFKFDFIAPLSFQLRQWDANRSSDSHNKWFWTGSWTYLQLTDDKAAENLTSKLPAFVEKYFPDRIKAGVEMQLQPLQDIHLNSHLSAEIEPNGNLTYIYIFSAIALLILLIASINFINLTTAKSASRAKEVGIRKVVGANKSQLICQIIYEAVLACSLAVVLAIGIGELCLPKFNDLTGRELSLGLFGNWAGMISLLGLVILIGFFSGIYPALLLSRFNPIGIMKSKFISGSGSDLFRRILVVTQFSVSIMLLIAIIVIYQQLNYLQQKNLGFDKEQVLFVKGRPEIDAKFEAFQDELLQNPGIHKVGAASNIPGEGMNAYRFIPEGGTADEPKVLPLLLVDYDFLTVMNIKIKNGRAISHLSPSDAEESFLLNQKALQQLGWEDNPIGKSMSLFAPGSNDIWKNGRVVGVIEDYHFESLHTEVKPLVITYFPRHTYYAIKLTAGNLKQSIASVTETWSEFCPEWPVEYFFLDRKLEQLYDSEQKLGEAINYFAVLAVLIAGLGLFGLATFAAERRTKEVGIRKVLGAKVWQLLGLLSTDFVIMVIIANVIAWPGAWFVMNRWLRDFAYRIEIDWWVFVVAGLLALFIAILTVSVQTVKATMANPVESLKYE